MLKSGKRRREYPLKVNRFILPKHQGPLGAKYIPLSKESMPYHIEAAEMQFYYTYMKQVRLIL
jgi:hypothetical protein